MKQEDLEKYKLLAIGVPNIITALSRTVIRDGAEYGHEMGYIEINNGMVFHPGNYTILLPCKKCNCKFEIKIILKDCREDEYDIVSSEHDEKFCENTYVL